MVSSMRLRTSTRLSLFISCLMSCSSASRAMSSIDRWNSRAMPRALAVHLPMVRATRGRSLGPITIRATIRMTAISDQPMSNIDRTPKRGARL
jgi:hypothetical protein